MLNPLTKTVYQGEEALQEYKNADFYVDAGKQAIVGGIVGGITGGAGALAHINIAGGKKSYNIQQSVSEVNTLNIKEDNLWKSGKGTDAQTNKIDAARQAEFENISKQLKGMDAEQRAETIKKYELSDMFTKEGDIKASAEQSAIADGNTAPTGNEARYGVYKSKRDRRWESSHRRQNYE